MNRRFSAWLGSLLVRTGDRLRQLNDYLVRTGQVENRYSCATFHPSSGASLSNLWTNPLDGKPLSGTRSVFVIGSPRSGTSVLGWAIAQHQDMWTGPEADFPYQFGRSRELERIWNLCAKRKGGWLDRHEVSREEYLASIGLGLDQLFRTRSKGQRWIDSTPANVLVAPMLAQLFPNAKFLHIVRDGRWVVNSLMRSGIDVRAAKDFTTATKTWRTYVNAGRKFGDAQPDRALEVRQEKMERNPESVMREVQCFLDLEHSDKPAEFLRTRRINSSYATTLRENLKETNPNAVPKAPWQQWSPSEKDTFRSLAMETMAELGYDTSLE